MAMADALCKVGALAATGVGGATACAGKRVPAPSIVGFSAFSSSSSKGERGTLRASLVSGFRGRKVVVGGWKWRAVREKSLQVQMKLVSFTTRWWEKGLHSNMKDITSAEDLVDSLLDAGNKLVIVDFFSPGCGGCKALHPKISQFADKNPDVLFLQINHEEHKSMCYSLNVHVLPFFRFYRGAHGRLCSFSCTNATIKKFRDALAKHSTERCSLGPARGLEESELLALAANKDLSFTYARKPEELVVAPGELVGPVLSGVQSAQLSSKKAEDNAFVTAWR